MRRLYRRNFLLMIVTSHATSGPIVREISARRGLNQKSAMMEPMIVRVSRSVTMTESVAAWPICSVLYVSFESSTFVELRS